MADMIMEATSVSTRTVCATPFLIQEITVSVDTNSASTVANPNVADADPAIGDTIFIPNQGPSGAKASLVIPVVNDRNMQAAGGAAHTTEAELQPLACVYSVVDPGTSVEENLEIKTGGALASATLGGSTVGAIKMLVRGTGTVALNGVELKLIAMYFEQASGGVTGS